MTTTVVRLSGIGTVEGLGTNQPACYANVGDVDCHPYGPDLFCLVESQVPSFVAEQQAKGFTVTLYEEKRK